MHYRRNADRDLRRAQRGAGADPQQEVRYLRERMRSGSITTDALRFAAALGHVPAQLAISWTPPDPPFSSPDTAMLVVAQENEWGHRMAGLWALACCEGTRWIWTEALETGFPRWGEWSAPENWNTPNNTLPSIRNVLKGDPCPGARSSRRGAWVEGHRLGIGAIEEDLAYMRNAPGLLNDQQQLLSDGVVDWLQALIHALFIVRPGMHTSYQTSLWGTHSPLAYLWVVDEDDSVPSTNVPLYARLARDAYRHAVFATNSYRGGFNTPSPVLDKAQLDVEAWTRKLLIPEVLA
jgi:hypothetical protein